MGKASGPNEPPRNLVEPWTKGTHAQRAAAEPDGTPRNTDRRTRRHRIHFPGFPALGLPAFPAPPFVQYPTFLWLRNAWYCLGVECRGAENGLREHGPNGPPRHLAGPHGTPTGGITPSIQPFSRISRFRSSRFLLQYSIPQYPTCGGFETPGIGRFAKYRSEGKFHRAQWTTAGPRGT